MKLKPLGNTDIAVSPLGLGTVKFGRNQSIKYPEQFLLPSLKELDHLVGLSYDLGINLLDTAPAYGESETRLGQLLHGKRQQWIIGSKAGEEFVDGCSHFDFSEKHLCFSVERSLQRLKTDYLDFLLIHSDGNDVQLIENFAVFSTLEKLKQQGKIRAYGMSSKTTEGGLATLQHAEIAMITYNPLYTEEKPVLDFAHQHNKGILIKKAFASGHLQQLPGENPIQHAMNFIFQQPGATSIILGTINPNHLQENIQIAEELLNT